MTQLSREDIAKGMAAIHNTLGPEKGRAFIRAIADGVLDDQLMTRMTSWMRQNPEAVQGVAMGLGAALGAFMAELLNPSPRRRAPSALSQLRQVQQIPADLFAPAPPPARPDPIPVEVEATLVDD